MELQKAINERRSIRSYTGEQISDAQLEAILTAAYEAPIGMGKYESIHLTIVTDKDVLGKIDANAAKFFGNPDMHPLYGAPMLIVISSAAQDNVASANVGIIIENMSLTAVEQGVGHVDIYGATAALAQNDALLAQLHLPDGFMPLGSIALGVSDEKYTVREIPQAHKFASNRI